MAGLFDKLLSGPQGPQAPSQEAKPSGLSGLFANYDLGSRLMMAAAFLQGQPGAAAGIAQHMSDNREKDDLRRSRAATRARLISKNPALADFLNAKEENVDWYTQQQQKDQMDTAKTAEQRAYDEGQAKIAAQAKAAADPTNIYYQQMQPQIEAQTPQGQMAVPGAMGPVRVGEAAPLPKGGITPQQVGVARAMGVPDVTPIEAGALMSGYGQGPEGARIALSDIKGDRERIAAAKILAADRKQAMRSQGISTTVDKDGNVTTTVGGSGAPKAPANYQWVDPADPRKGVEPIRGGPADVSIEDQKAKDAATDALKIRKADVVNQSIADIRKTMKESLMPGVGTPTNVPFYTSFVPGAVDIKNTLNLIQGNMAIDKLQEMRDNAPGASGASGLGQLTAPELYMLKNLAANLEQSNSPELFNKNLDAFEAEFNRVVYGEGGKPKGSKSGNRVWNPTTGKFE